MRRKSPTNIDDPFKHACVEESALKKFGTGETHWFVLVFRREPRNSEDLPSVWRARVLQMPRSSLNQGEQIGAGATFESLEDVPEIVRKLLNDAVGALEQSASPNGRPATNEV